MSLNDSEVWSAITRIIRQSILDWLPSLIDINIPVGFHFYSGHFLSSCFTCNIYYCLLYSSHPCRTRQTVLHLTSSSTRYLYSKQLRFLFTYISEVVTPNSSTSPSHNTWNNEIFLIILITKYENTNLNGEW